MTAGGCDWDSVHHSSTQEAEIFFRKQILLSLLGSTLMEEASPCFPMILQHPRPLASSATWWEPGIQAGALTEDVVHHNTPPPTLFSLNILGPH